MPRKDECSVCDRNGGKGRKEIDLDICSTMTYADIERRHRLKHATLLRHVAGGHPAETLGDAWWSHRRAKGSPKTGGSAMRDKHGNRDSRGASAPIPSDELDLTEIRIESAQDVWDVVGRQLARLERVVVQAERAGDLRGVVAGSQAILKNLTELHARFYALITDAPQVDARTQNLTLQVAGAPTQGLRAFLAVIAAAGDEKVAALVNAIDQLGLDEVKHVVAGLLDRAAPKALGDGRPVAALDAVPESL